MATYNRTITYNLMSQPVDINYWLVEQPVYGSGRLGIRSSTGYLVRKASYGQFGRITDYRTTYAGLTTRTIGHKQYELTDHLGNVRVVFDDRITGTLQTNTLKPNILATNSYYPYGMLIKSLSQNSEVYRWGFQGHEQDNEIKGIGNHLRFGDYGYDTRLGRRWNLDPVDQVGISNYAVFGDNPIIFVDPDGKQIRPSPARTRRSNNYNLRNYNSNYSLFYNGIQPKSTIQTTRYQRAASMTPIYNEKYSYIQNIETAGGNKVQMSNNNKAGMAVTSIGDMAENVNNYFQLINTVIYNSDGRVENRTMFILTDSKDIEKQRKWEKEYKKLIEEIGQMPIYDPNDSEGLKKVAEYQQTVRDRIGISPIQRAKIEHLQHPEKFEQVSTKKEIMPEFRPEGGL